MPYDRSVTGAADRRGSNPVQILHRVGRYLAVDDRGLLLMLAGIWLVLVVPLASGARTLYFRDVFGFHLPLRALVARELAAGRLPAFEPAWALGQALRGNPNAFAFFPDTLLFLWLDFWSAFNLHFVLHWLIAFLGLRRLARELGQSPTAATMAGMVFALGGFTISMLTFGSTIAVVAWATWAMVGALRGGPRGIALGALSWGLALLGGEPVFAAVAIVPLVLAANERQDPRRALATSTAILLLGALVAAPQLVATARILPFTFRGGHGIAAGGASEYFLAPERLLELVLPFPFGIPGEVGPLSTWRALAAPGAPTAPPYILTLFLGLPALALACAAARRHRLWAALAASGLIGPWLGGYGAATLSAMTAGLFRYPEKILLWYALGIALLAGWGLDELAPGRRRAPTALLVGGLSALALAAVIGVGPGAEVVHSILGVPRAIAVPQGNLLALLLALGALTAVASARALTGARHQTLVAIQLFSLLPLLLLVRTEATAPYRRPPQWLDGVPRGASIVASAWQYPSWQGETTQLLPAGPPASASRLAAADLHFVPGLLFGLRYPTAPDGDGLQSPLSTFLARNLAGSDMATRLRWLRILGTDAVVLHEARDEPFLAPLATAERGAVTVRLYRMVGSAPSAWWPRSVRPAPNPVAALAWLGRQADPISEVVVSQPITHHAGGRVEVLRDDPDHLAIAVDGEGGLLVVRRAYQPLYRATASGRRLATQPVQLMLLGVEVPAGHQQVRIDVSSWPEGVAGAVALVVVAVLASVWWRNRRMPG